MNRRHLFFASHSPLNPADWRVRILLLLTGLSLLGVLWVTRFLNPDVRGLGTHEQLGLPPCGFHQLLGWPCPSCGMTTAWSFVVRGQIGQACAVHFGAVLLAGMVLITGIWLVSSALFRCWIVGWPTNLTWAATTGILLTAILVTWIFKLLL